jgi:hypothetical protein
MAADKRERTLTYRRALWLNDDPATISLESCVRQACEKLKTVGERTIIHGEGQYVSIASEQRDAKKGVLLHLTAETPGEAASIVPVPLKTSEKIDVSTTLPPKDFEFMDGDAFLYVIGDDVCLCSTSMMDGGIAYFFREIFKIAKLRKDADRFELAKTADINKIALIKRSGIKEIEIRATLFQASTDYVRRKTQPFSLLGAVNKHFKALLGKENDATNDALKAVLTFKVDRRIRGGITLGEKRVEQLATELVKSQEEGDDYVIVTKDDLACCRFRGRLVKLTRPSFRTQVD